jgi:hypothetical protein
VVAAAVALLATTAGACSLEIPGKHVELIIHTIFGVSKFREWFRKWSNFIGFKLTSPDIRSTFSMKTISDLSGQQPQPIICVSFMS